MIVADDPPPRTRRQRKRDTLQRLERDVDAWVATADPGGGTTRDLLRNGTWLDWSGGHVSVPRLGHLRRPDAATARAVGT
jgi:hypothetical protein